MAAKSSTPPKLDIFRVLAAAGRKNTDFYSTLTPEEQKAMQPILVTRWMSGTQRADQIVYLNEIINPFVFSLSSHKQLLWHLMTIASVAGNQKCNWIKSPAKTTKKAISASVVSQYYKYSTSRAIDALALLTVEDILEMGVDLGCQTDELAKIKKEWLTT